MKTVKIEVTNKFTGSKEVYEVKASDAWSALNYHNSRYNVSSARFV